MAPFGLGWPGLAWSPLVVPSPVTVPPSINGDREQARKKGEFLHFVPSLPERDESRRKWKHIRQNTTRTDIKIPTHGLNLFLEAIYFLYHVTYLHSYRTYCTFDEIEGSFRLIKRPHLFHRCLNSFTRRSSIVDSTVRTHTRHVGTTVQCRVYCTGVYESVCGSSSSIHPLSLTHVCTSASLSTSLGRMGE